MKLVSTSLPQGFDCVDEYVYLYNVSANTIYQGSIAALDFDTGDATFTGGTTSAFTRGAVATALSASAGVCTAYTGTAGLAVNALGKFQIRGKQVTVRPSTGGVLVALTKGWGGTVANAFPGITFAAAPGGQAKVCAVLTSASGNYNGGTVGLNDHTPVLAFFDGINGLR